MIEKQNFYHGAAIMELFEHPKCTTIGKVESGFIVNDKLLIFIKYTTKQRTPWGFNITNDDLIRMNKIKESDKIFIVFVCGGDGICVINFKEANVLIANRPGWISIKRKFGKQYTVSGPCGELKYKISVNRGSKTLFEK